MAPRHFTIDCYAELELTQTADLAAIKSAYRRLARLRHPDKNIHIPQATAHFQRLQEAYSTLSDPDQRRLFDLHYPSIRQTKPSDPSSSQNNSRYEAPRTEPAQRSSPWTNGTNTSGAGVQELEREIENLVSHRRKLDNDRFELKRDINKNQSVLDRLKAEEDQHAQEDVAMNSWFGYFFRAKPSDKETEERNRVASGRRTGRLVVERKLDNGKAQLAGITLRLHELDKTIQEKRSKQEEIRKAEMRQREAVARKEHEERLRKARQEAEVRQKEEDAQRAAAAEKRRRDKEAEYAETRRRERETAERFEEIRRNAYREAETRRQEEATRRTAVAEAQRRAQEVRRAAAETQRKAKQEQTQREKASLKESARSKTGTPSRASNATKSTTCQHKGWWQQVNGRNICQRCESVQRRFAFSCPGCQIIACAGCRQKLKGAVRNS
ncbi:Chaperone protein DnaJ [Cladobotryum mycophilum]|uniref:Chaperone protein DnaJ n=1 Tax=Cladobotryum mycophilum TaxID=491253 RepID=A0ABR0SW42_9HYPO